MEKTNEIFQDTNDEYDSPYKSDVEKIFKAWDFERVIQIVLDDGREIAQATPGFEDDFGTVMLHIVPCCVEADAWLGGLSPSDEDVRNSGYYDDKAMGRKEYSFCEAFDKKGSHRTWGLRSHKPMNSRAELMMRFACLQHLTHASVMGSKVLEEERAKCLPQNGYSTHKGAISFYAHYQGQNLLHFSLGFAGALDEHDNWDDACEYDCTSKVAKNLWNYLEQTVEQYCDLHYPRDFGAAAICTTEGMKKDLKDL